MFMSIFMFIVIVIFISMCIVMLIIVAVFMRIVIYICVVIIDPGGAATNCYYGFPGYQYGIKYRLIRYF